MSTGITPIGALAAPSLALPRSRGRERTWQLSCSWIAVAMFLGFAVGLHANPTAANDPALEARVKAIATELRCLVCQNQTVADSDAAVAQDMRREVREQLLAGKSEAEIKRYMTERFGDFVLYRPPLKASTIALWAGPFVLLALGGFVLMRRLRQRPEQVKAPATLDEAARRRARALLGEDS